MKESKKEHNTFYITHRLEILVWLIVVFIILAVYTVIHEHYKKADNDYAIYMNDVDGLIVGSPVRMMGIEVGHITKIKPTNEEVYVKFILNDSTIEIPQGTVATVEFSGIAGSKSLELYLPDKNTFIDNSVKLITVTPPKRLHDAAGLLCDMFDKLTSIIYTSSSFGEKVKDISTTELKEQDMNSFLNYTGKLLNESTKSVSGLGDKLKKYQDYLEENNGKE